jgi:hypothetical protein
LLRRVVQQRPFVALHSTADAPTRERHPKLSQKGGTAALAVCVLHQGLAV